MHALTKVVRSNDGLMIVGRQVVFFTKQQTHSKDEHELPLGDIVKNPVSMDLTTFERVVKGNLSLDVGSSLSKLNHLLEDIGRDNRSEVLRRFWLA